MVVDMWNGAADLSGIEVSGRVRRGSVSTWRPAILTVTFGCLTYFFVDSFFFFLFFPGGVDAWPWRRR